MGKRKGNIAATKNPVIAGVLSALVPGLGQIYAGAWKRGLTLLLGLSAQGGLFYGVGLTWMAYALAVIWPWVILDAVLLAEDRKTARHSSIARVLGLYPIIIILILNLIAAFKVTEIRIPKLQAEQRGVIWHIVGGLGSPDFVTPRGEEQVARGKYIVPGPGAPDNITPTIPEKNQPVLKLSPLKVVSGGTIDVNGSRFTPGAKGEVRISGAETAKVGEFTADRQGRFKLKFVNPRYIPGDYRVKATALVQSGGWQISETLQVVAPRMFETIYLALLGTALSLIFAIPLSFFGARNLMHSPPLKVLYGLTRGLFTVLRSVEVLIIAVIAVAAVGIGPFAGVLALAIHGIGALGKLYSESIESIEHGPIEAVKSTGANEFQVVLFGVVPQVVPQFIAFTLYRWDINVRMATVIGLVGGGGIGYVLMQYMSLLQWRQAATAIWLIAGVVMLMDYASAVIREKIV